jgi:hypothetical protein
MTTNDPRNANDMHLISDNRPACLNPDVKFCKKRQVLKTFSKFKQEQFQYKMTSKGMSIYLSINKNPDL